MMLAYFDSSALVKLVVEERGSSAVAEVWDGADAVISSRVAHPEVRAALAAAERAGRFGRAEHERARGAWDGYRVSLRLVELTADVEERAGDLAQVHALSGFDAVHLASADVLGGAPTVIVTWDARLHAAARSTGFATTPSHL